jgi:thymidylate kinase
VTHALFVAIEGLCCTGKTTVVRGVSTALDAVHLPTVPDDYAPLRQRLQQAEELNARFLLFMSAVSLASLNIRRHVEAGWPVVVESYVARTVAFHRGMGASAQVVLPDLLLPDVSFQLTCERSERHRRRQRRGGHRHYWDRWAEACEAAILREYRRFAMHLIDTTHLSPSGVVTAILHHPLDGSCTCEDTQPLARHQDLLSAIPRRLGEPRGQDRLRGGCLGR